MRRSSKFTAVALVSILEWGCHKKTLQSPPLLPSSQAPATTPNQTEQTPPASRRTTPPVTSPAPHQPEFRLGQALTPEELRANNVILDRHLERATQALAVM